MTEYTNAEIMRRLDDLVRQNTIVLAEIKEDRRILAERYVTKEIHDRDVRGYREAHDRDIKDIHDDIQSMIKARESDVADKKKAEDRWKQAVFGLGVQAVMMLIVAFISFSNFVARSGG